MASMETRVRQSSSRQEVLRVLGVTMERVEAGEVELRMPVSPALQQQHGYVHAGALSTIADTAAGYAAMSLLSEGMEVLTVEFKINLLAPAAGEYLTAKARVIRSGKRITVSACDVFSVTGTEEKCVATLLATIAHR